MYMCSFCESSTGQGQYQGPSPVDDSHVTIFATLSAQTRPLVRLLIPVDTEGLLPEGDMEVLRPVYTSKSNAH